MSVPCSPARFRHGRGSPRLSLISLGFQLPTRYEPTASFLLASTSDQVHACQTMTTVQTVSIVAKNKYSGKAGGLPHPSRGGTKVRKPFTRVRTEPAMIFA